MRSLLQIAHTDVVAIDDLSRVVALVAVEDGEQGRFARAVAPDKGCQFALFDCGFYLAEQGSIPVAYG